MVQKVHGWTKPGNFTGKELNYYRVRTLLDITPTGRLLPLEIVNPKGTYPFKVDANDTVSYSSAAEYENAVKAQYRFDKLMETVSLRAQPIIIGSVSKKGEVKADINDLAAVDNVEPWASMASTAVVDVFEVTIAIEHDMAWEPAGNQADLPESLHGVGGKVADDSFSFENPTHSRNNVSVSFVGSRMA